MLLQKRPAGKGLTGLIAAKNCGQKLDKKFSYKNLALILHVVTASSCCL